jgi:hypothetical protein
MGKEILTCVCSSVEHQIIIRYETAENQVYANSYLADLPLWKRIANAVKYIFGYKSKYGNIEEFIFDKRDIPVLENVVTHLKNVD